MSPAKKHIPSDATPRPTPDHGSHPRVLGLRAGDDVVVRPESEILATLDANGTLDGVPFMPEMLRFAGQRLRVYRRADKVCDTVTRHISRRMHHTVFLDGLRCDGSAHGGCQAGCLMFWKEAWLRRSGTSEDPLGSGADPAPSLTRDTLMQLTRRPSPPGTDSPEPRYVCQVTQLPFFGPRIPWWHPLPYLREVLTRNVPLGTFVQVMARSWCNALQRLRGGRERPYVKGRLEGPTPARRLDLKPGELVRIRPLEEIVRTLHVWGRNRGLWYDVEMVGYSGGEYRVSHRVNRIIQEDTGHMIEWSGDCVVLEGVACKGCLSRERLFCARSIHHYWREIWLERVEEPPQ